MPGATAITAGEFWRSTCLYTLNPTIQPASSERAVSYASRHRRYSRRVLGVPMPISINPTIQAASSEEAVSYACGNRYHSRRVLGEVLAMPGAIAWVLGVHLPTSIKLPITADEF